MTKIKNIWVLADSENIAKIKEVGSVVSPSALISHDVHFCAPVHVSPQCQIKHNVKIDRFTFLNWNTIIYPNVYVGAYCSIGRGVEIGLAQHPTNWLSTHTMQYSDGWFPNLAGYKSEQGLRHKHHRDTKIGSDVWMGNGAKVVSGVAIGHGAIVAAGAIVVKNVEPYTIVGGVPAKVIGKRFDDETIEKLLASRWWTLPHDVINKLPFNNVGKVLEILNDREK